MENKQVIVASESEARASVSTELVTVPSGCEPAPDEDQQQFMKWLQANRNKNIRVMVSGKTGAGKSSLLNYVFGTKFEVGHEIDKAKTTAVTMKTSEKNGIKLELYDSPGLQDGSGNEAEYLRNMTQVCQELDLFIFCVPMLDTRSDLDQNASALQKITKALGDGIWDNAIVVLTFSNIVSKRMIQLAGSVDESGDRATKMFEDQVVDWQASVRDALAKAGVSERLTKGILIHPTGHSKVRSLPGQDDWISETWAKFLQSTKENAKPLIIQMELGQEGGFLDEKDEDLEKYKSMNITTQNRKIILTPAVKAAMGVTGVTAGAVATGAAVGALIGALAIGVPSFGVAAGVGLVIGSAVGGGIGVCVGSLYGFYVKYKTKNLLKK